VVLIFVVLLLPTRFTEAIVVQLFLDENDSSFGVKVKRVISDIFFVAFDDI
jgi:hypothetical protein